MGRGLVYDAEVEAFSNELIHVFPQELHEQDEDHDEKREQESAQERLGDVSVEFLHALRLNVQM